MPAIHFFNWVLFFCIYHCDVASSAGTVIVERREQVTLCVLSFAYHCDCICPAVPLLLLLPGLTVQADLLEYVGCGLVAVV